LLRRRKGDEDANYEPAKKEISLLRESQRRTLAAYACKGKWSRAGNQGGKKEEEKKLDS
jgi:hypothetical protein